MPYGCNRADKPTNLQTLSIDQHTNDDSFLKLDFLLQAQKDAT